MSNVAPLPTPDPTPTRVRSYASARADGVPKIFTIDDEDFACMPKLPAVVSLDAGRRLDEMGTGEDKQAVGRAGLGLLNDFFDVVLLRNDAGEHGDKSSRERFQDLLRSPDRIVEGSLLEQIYRDLMEAYTARPTEPPSASPG